MEIIIAFSLGALAGIAACAAWVRWMMAALERLYAGPPLGLESGAHLRRELPNLRSPPAAVKWLARSSCLRRRRRRKKSDFIRELR